MAVERLAKALGKSMGETASPLKWGPTFIADAVTSEDKTTVERWRIDPELVHVSSMVGWCPRQYALMRQSGDVMPEKNGITGGHRVMWEVGRAVERHVRNQFIKRVNYRGVFGGWICKCEKTKRIGFYRDRKCSMCHTRVNVYVEYSVVDSRYRVVGHPDLILLVDGKIVFVEIKSITNANAKAPGSFSMLVRPQGDHEFQVNSYYWMGKRGMIKELAKYEVHDEVVILYTTKDFKWGSPYKEFHYTPTKQAMALVKEEFVKAKELTTNLPARSLCKSDTCSRAVGCPVALECFSKRS